MPGKIYLVSLNGVPKYVGFTTKTVEDRWKKHICDSKKNKCPALHSAINKYGPEAFTVTEIYSSDDVDHTLNVMEPQFIREHKTHVDDGGYNLSVGGDGGWLGRKHTQETKEKIRQANLRLGKKPPSSLGRKQSAETKEKIRQSMMGKTLTEETKEKIRQANLRLGTKPPSCLGRKLSAETKEKLRSFNLGKTLSEETRKKMSQAQRKRWLTTSPSCRKSHTSSEQTQVPNTPTSYL